MNKELFKGLTDKGLVEGTDCFFFDNWWSDDITFAVSWGYYRDEDGDEYHYLCEYHKDEEKFWFLRIYDDDIVDAHFTEEQQEFIIKEMRKLM